ncbi:uncharacterized protein L201_000952 [Kwoniella dendrophila CBS 6074]|uniref:Nucleolus and neural progenitor protein-like N-terminal domain-containing protein n=1 Tax=Kwoniella dendrophila CBS 6074 TaxID=1295534 RepID=A0AAX4JL22_9TREE
MSTSASPSLGGPSTPLYRIQIHSSVSSHLSTELSSLQTLLLRARDQHRTQLFLRRMYEVLRIGKALLTYIKDAPSDDQQKWEKRKLRGERLVNCTIKSLFTAQRLTSQVIELHHFLPLQTSVLAIYARLFTITLNIANGLGMDLERLISSGGIMSKSKLKQKNTKGDVKADNGIRTDQRESKPNKQDIIAEMGLSGVEVELGEKVERMVSTSATPSASSSEPKLTGLLDKSESRANSPKFSRNNSSDMRSAQRSDKTSSHLFSITNDDTAEEDMRKRSKASQALEETPDVISSSTPSTVDTIKKKKKKRPLDMDVIFEKTENPKNKQTFELTDSAINGPIKQIKKSQTTEKQNELALLGDDTSQVKKKVKTKKKKDTMDDIFGF